MYLKSLSSQTQQLLPLFAYFSSALTTAEELLDEYLLLLWQTNQFPDYPFHLCFPMIEELIAKGFWKQVLPGYEIFSVNPLLEYQTIQSLKVLSPIQQTCIQDCFVQYYQTVIIPKSIQPYLTTPDLETKKIGLLVTQYEVENLERCILLAINSGTLSADMYAMLSHYWDAIGQQEKSIRLMDILLDDYFPIHPKSEILPTLLFLHAGNQKILNKFEKALKTINYALSILSKKDNRKAILFQQKGTILKDLDRHQEAIPLFQKALAIYEQVGDKEKMAEMYQNLGVISYFEQDYSNFQTQTEKAIAMYDLQNRQHAKALAYQNLADVWLKKGLKEKAIKTYQEALKIFKSFNDELNYAAICRNIAIVYFKERNFHQTKFWQQKALEIYLTKGSAEERALLWFDYGALALDQENFSESLIYYERALKDYSDLKNKGQTHHMIAYIHHHYLQNPMASLKDYGQAIVKLNTTPKDDEWFKLNFNYGNALMELKQYDKAICQYKIAIEFSTDIKEITTSEIAYLFHNATLACYYNKSLEEGEIYLEKTKRLYEQLEDKESWEELLAELNVIDK